MKEFFDFLSEKAGVSVCSSYDINDKTCLSGCMAKEVEDGDDCPWKGVPARRMNDCPCYEPAMTESEAPSTTMGSGQIATKEMPLGKKKDDEEDEEVDEGCKGKKKMNEAAGKFVDSKGREIKPGMWAINTKAKARTGRNQLIYILDVLDDGRFRYREKDSDDIWLAKQEQFAGYLTISKASGG